ncbi:hypothetical protein BBI01_03640 [Chryseobacterium artocarpi]|uniref:PNPLA domain-containing protein n=1 Tax=Chryseobacterium artocarpi TaxID=1414727 RepID=A0A1B9A161_9FLAO|nr:patatin-like phospholipase family protein [Chryseobacterium artocarpi]OCA77552.1 hypothetical protein BBI01_03640 [Chryseobacterium artocarpi]
MTDLEKNTHFKILVLDGGGSKGVYTLGILKELELKLGSPLCEHFNLIYGTSTGSIIGALLALGKSISEIKELYDKNIPVIMSKANKKSRSKALKELADLIFKDLKFEDFKTDVGIVAVNYSTQNPLIFKSNKKQAHGMAQSFIPGFGCTISEAVQASCSAYPIFNRKIVTTVNNGVIDTLDGGFIANNATLFALVDADKAFKVSSDNIRLLSLGTGSFIESPMKGLIGYLSYLKFFKFVGRILTSSTNTNVILAKLLYPHIRIVRINDVFNQPEYGTNMLEKNKRKLEKLFQLGRNSFASKEAEIENLFNE